MTKWQLQDAKARFSELIDDTLAKGPQMVTRRGVDTAVVVSVEEWRKLKDEKRLTWKEVLLGDGPRFELPLAKRGSLKSRKSPVPPATNATSLTSPLQSSTHSGKSRVNFVCLQLLVIPIGKSLSMQPLRLREHLARL